MDATLESAFIFRDGIESLTFAGIMVGAKVKEEEIGIDKEPIIPLVLQPWVPREFLIGG